MWVLSILQISIMGSSSSKIDKSEAMRLCKERKKFIKQAIDSRYALSATHLSYIQSLRSIGIALRRFAEAEVLIESSLSTSATELDKTPSPSSYPSPSPSHIAEIVDSPLHSGSPLSPLPSRLSYMRSAGNASMTVKLVPSFVEDESLTFHSPPPPPPPLPNEIGSSWDYFDATDESLSFRFMGENGFDLNFDNANGLRQFRGEQVVPCMEEEGESCQKASLNCNGEICIESGNLARQSKENGRLVLMPNVNSFGGITPKRLEMGERKLEKPECIANGSKETLGGNAALQQSISKREKPGGGVRDSCDGREDPCEFITHRAKDFLSSIKDIEHRFFRASESGKEVSRMLEANKIRLKYAEVNGSSPTSVFLAAFHLTCCQKETALTSNEPSQHMTKVITWNRSLSSQSSSSKNPLASASKDDIDDSGSDFAEEFCMIAGSHSSTLDRLYAWERKLYDEVKACESIRKKYDHKCNQLRHQFAKDANTHVIDRTRAVVKDLHSQIRVGLHAVDSIAKRIEKLRDKELQPQLVELIQGLIRMWKTMLECHHAQYITISLAYHSKSSTTVPTNGESYRQVFLHLQHEIECFGSSFADWVDAHISYVEALNGWLQHCILLPRERLKGRRAFSPRRALAPPIFVLFRDWSLGIKALPAGEVKDAFKAFVSDLNTSMAHQTEQQKQQGSSNSDNNEEPPENREDENSGKSSNLTSIHASLTKALDGLTKFAEASRKMCEDLRQGTEAARIAYTNYGTTTRYLGGL